MVTRIGINRLLIAGLLATSPLVVGCGSVSLSDDAGAAGAGDDGPANTVPHEPSPDAGALGGDPGLGATVVCSPGSVTCGAACLDAQALAGDPSNCGRCGHSCQGGACQRGACQPVVLASGQLNPTFVTATADEVFWTNSGDPTNGGQGGAVMRGPRDGGARTVVAAAQAGPTQLVLAGAAMFWTLPEPGVVMRTMLSGGSPASVVTGQRANSLLSDGTSLFWLDPTPGTISTLSLDNGAITTLATGQSGIQCQLAVDDHRLYFTSPTSIHAVSLTGGSPVTVVSGQINACSVVVTPSYLYWTNLANGGTIMRARLDGTEAITLVSGRPGPSSLALDETALYWTENGVAGGSPSALATAPLGGGPATVLAFWPRDTVGMAGSVFADDRSLFWILIPNVQGSAAEGSVMKLAKP